MRRLWENLKIFVSFLCVSGFVSCNKHKNTAIKKLKSDLLDTEKTEKRNEN